MINLLLAGRERVTFPWKSFFLGLGCALAWLILPLRSQDNGPPPSDNGASAQDEAGGAPDSAASFQTFYDALGSQGTWIQSSDYGYVWQPQVNDPGWAPYTAGHWVYTDDGWTWVSDEPWGWATYHYGRWVNLDGTGWCWVPGYTWAPAWVSWRYGDDNCGWAPLPPDSFVGVDYSDGDTDFSAGFHIGGDCDGFYGIGAAYYIFLPVRCLGYRNYHGYYHDRGDNFALINHTTNVTNLNVTRNRTGENFGGTAFGAARFRHVTTGGPMLAQVNAVSQIPVQRVNLVRTNQPGGGGALTANSLAIYAPQVGPGSSTALPSRVAGAIGRTTVNRGLDITRPLAVNARLAPAPATEAQVQGARLAQDHAPAGAKVMTDSATVRPILQAPLTSLRPIARPVFSSAGAPATGFSNASRSSSEAGLIPAPRVYPQTGEGGGVPSRAYYPGTVHPSAPPSFQPRSVTTEPGGGSEYPPYVRPTAPATAYPAPGARPSAGGSSGGGYPSGRAGRAESSGGYSKEEVGRAESSGRSSGGGGYSNGGAHSSPGGGGGNSSQNH